MRANHNTNRTEAVAPDVRAKLSTIGLDHELYRAVVKLFEAKMRLLDE